MLIRMCALFPRSPKSHNITHIHLNFSNFQFFQWKWEKKLCICSVWMWGFICKLCFLLYLMENIFVLINEIAIAVWLERITKSVLYWLMCKLQIFILGKFDLSSLWIRQVILFMCFNLFFLLIVCSKRNKSFLENSEVIELTIQWTSHYVQWY